jgi:hypothetical protein
MSGQWTTGQREPCRPQGSKVLVRITRGTGWGKPQGGEIPREPGRRLRRGNPVAVVPTGRRMKPLKRRRCGETRNEGTAIRTVADPGHCRSTERSLRQEAVMQVARLAEGRYPRRWNRRRSRLVRAIVSRPISRIAGGEAPPRGGRFRSCQALKGEPRERARLKEIGESVEGGRRRGAAEARGRNVTREVECPGVCGS